jgi:hypothetical protein
VKCGHHVDLAVITIYEPAVRTLLYRPVTSDIIRIIRIKHGAAKTRRTVFAADDTIKRATAECGQLLCVLFRICAYGLDLSGSGWGLVAASCEQGRIVGVSFSFLIVSTVLSLSRRIAFSGCFYGYWYY